MLAKYSVKKPFTVIVAMIMVVVLGVISFFNMTTDLLPSLNLPYVVVVTTYPGAAPERVETMVTKPLEQSLSTTSGLVELNSVSSENSSMIIMEFNQQVNMDSVIIEMNGNIDMLKAYWPSEIGTPMIMRINPDMLPIMVASLDVDGKTMEELSDFATREIIPEFDRIDGVASVEASGLLSEAVHIKLDQEKIDNINKSLLASVNGQLAEGQTALDEAKAKLAEGKAELEAQQKIQSAKLSEAQMLLDEGKVQVTTGLTAVTVGETALKTVMDETQTQLTQLLEKQAAGSTTSDEDQLITYLQAGMAELNTQMQSLNAQHAELTAAQTVLNEKQKELDYGLLMLTSETTKAATQIAAGEATLEEKTEEFESARDEALKKANIDSIVTQSMISNILTAENFSMPAGYVEEDGKDYLVKVGEKFESVNELSNMLLMDTGAKVIGKIYLSDVATIEEYNNAGAIYAKVNGNDAVILTFQKQSTSSTVDVADKINETIKTLSEEHEGLHVTALMDQGVYINMVIDSVLQNLMFGGILAILILLIFLGDLRPTIIIAFSIPISLLFALAMMYFTGLTLNIISLAGLALGVGMLVDNSIVVIENIYRLRSEGVGPIKAAIQGTTQVAGAIAASTLTTICVFLPIVFTEGLSRQLFTDMGLTIAFSLIASLIVAMTLVPMMSSTLLKNSTEKEHKLFDKFIAGYEKLLRGALNHRIAVLLVVVVVFGYSVFEIMSMGTSFLPDMDAPQMSMTITVPEDATQEEIAAQTTQVLDKLLEIEDIETVGAMQSSEGSLTVDVYIILKEKPTLSNKEVNREILSKTETMPIEVSVSDSMMDISMLSGNGIAINVRGNDLDKLQTVAKEVSEIIENTEGTSNVSYGQEKSSTETRITVDKNKAMEYGLTVAQVYQRVNELIADGKSATTITVGEKDYPVIVYNSTREDITRGNLSDITFAVTIDGQEQIISLSEIATIQEAEGMASIRRTSQVRYMSVSADIADGYNVGLVNRDLAANLANYTPPAGYDLDFQGENEMINDALGDLVLMILLAIVFIYLIMVGQFQSLMSPFIVMFTLPLAFTGGLLGLLITGKTLSIISMLGFLVLAGVVVNNGIVFVDYVNQLRLAGMSKHEALVETGKARIRPILMTAITTILGLSTLALGVGAGADMLQPMGIVVVGGLAYATLLTLFVVPILYDFLQRKDLKPIEEEA